MADLILKFTDETGINREITIAKASFTIGRTPDNDLVIANNNLSRRHAQIERFGNVFVISDCNSSNGTSVNGKHLNEPLALKNADQILLGNAVRLSVELIEDNFADWQTNNSDLTTATAQGNLFSHANANSGSPPIWQNVFLLAPLFGVFILLLTIVLFFAFSGTAGNNRILQTDNANEDLTELNEQTEENRRTARKNDSSTNDEELEGLDNKELTQANSSNNSSAENLANNNSVNISNVENERIEKFARIFLRQISSDPNPVLTGKQIASVNTKLKTYQNMSAVRENLRTAKRNAAGFEQLAQTHKLNSKFLMATALAKLDQTRGDPLATAAAIAPDLRKYGNVLGLELADDCLLAVAAYSEDNSPLAMRDKVANLAKQTPNVSAGTIRTIWFLHDNKKISDSAYDFALKFLALGTMIEENG